jgi:hypothetical protein
MRAIAYDEPTQRKLASVFGDRRASLLRDQMKAQYERYQTWGGVMSTNGSQTALRADDLSDVGGAIPTTPQGMVMGLINRARQSGAMLTPNEMNAMAQMAVRPIRGSSSDELAALELLARRRKLGLMAPRTNAMEATDTMARATGRVTGGLSGRDQNR